ncbi:hypothetical protein IFM58399_02517, partial [Aspergillus lentulus]
MPVPLPSKSSATKHPLSSRFLYNENIRLRERYVEFDPNVLLREAEKHMDPSHGRAQRLTKFAEGRFNPVFLLAFDDGFEALPKFHNESRGPSTMRPLAKRPLSIIFTPKYIVMEKAPGVGLETKWPSMDKRDLHKLASSFVEIEKRFFDIPFGSIGSIYFKKDVPPELQAALYSASAQNNRDSEMFCIGPTADYMFWYGKRAGLNLYRGPWNDPKKYLASIAEKEIEWTRQYGKPVQLDFPHNGVFPGEKSPEDYLCLLDNYLTLAPYLLPKEPDNPLNRPTLRHPDLNPNNIFISPDSGAISCIIDWQHATVEPRLLVAGHPRAFENPDPEQSPELKEPSLPSDYESLSAQEKAEAGELYRRRLLFYYYRIFNGHLNKPHLEALRDPILLPRQHLVDRAGRQWNGNLMTLKGALVRMTDYWPHLPDTKGLPCPVRFTEAELDGFHEQEQLWFDLNKVVNHWRDQIGGVNEDGWISNEQYDEAIRKVAELKASLVASAEGDEEDIRLLER